MGFQKNISLKNYTTFKIGGPARYFFIVRTKGELVRVVKTAKESELRFFVLGAGSNLLVSDKGFNGLVIKIQNTEYKIQDTRIVAGAGATMGELVKLSLKNSLGGLEWMAGIPGTLGGAVRGNAGAFGLAMADSVESVEALDVKSLKFKVYSSNECRFGYRQSVFKKNKNLIIFSATLKLKKENKEKINKEIKEYSEHRKRRHPREPSAGSVFKNIKFSEALAKKFPQFGQFQEKGKIPAAFLIGECGLRGKKIGGAKISEMHPNFILNFKNAKAENVKKLIRLAKQKVKNKFGINLEEEIGILG